MSATSTMSMGTERCGDVEDGYDRYLTNVQTIWTPKAAISEMTSIDERKWSCQ